MSCRRPGLRPPGRQRLELRRLFGGAHGQLPPEPGVRRRQRLQQPGRDLLRAAGVPGRAHRVHDARPERRRPLQHRGVQHRGGRRRVPEGTGVQRRPVLARRPPRATCDHGARCPPDTPVCRWKSGAGTCITTSEADALRSSIRSGGAADSPSVLACTKPSDCGAGLTCCNDTESRPPDMPSDEVLVTTCMHACGSAKLDDVCARQADCPLFLATGLHGGLRRQRCVPRSPSDRHPALGACALPLP